MDLSEKPMYNCASSASVRHSAPSGTPPRVTQHTRVPGNVMLYFLEKVPEAGMYVCQRAYHLSIWYPGIWYPGTRARHVMGPQAGNCINYYMVVNCIYYMVVESIYLLGN